MAALGTINNYSVFSRYSHNWADGMNRNMLKAAVSLHLSVLAIVDELPLTPAANDTYILSTDSMIYVYANGEWNTILAVFGTQAFVQDEESIYLFNGDSQWQLLFDLNADHQPIERNLSFFAPGILRPSGVVFNFVPTMEFKVPAGAPNSYATLEVPPTGGALTINISALGGTGSGTITFADGSTNGVFAIPTDLVVLPAEFETQYSTPQQLRMTLAGPESYGAEGLSVSLKGEIRAIDQ